MSTVAEYTLSEMILLAAHKLEEHGQSPFSAEELIVSSWQHFPRAFGLKGYHDQYPDSNRVLSSIMGEKGLAKKGWLEKKGQKLYALTKEGQRVVRRMSDGFAEEPDEDDTSPARLPRDQERLLLSLLDSTAFGKYVNKKSVELSFADACRFWHIVETQAGDVLDERLAVVEKTLGLADRLAQRAPITVGHREVSAADVELLHDVHDHLLERFSRHLNVLRNRE